MSSDGVIHSLIGGPGSGFWRSRATRMKRAGPDVGPARCDSTTQCYFWSGRTVKYVLADVFDGMP